MVEVDVAPFDISEVFKPLTKSRVVRPFFFGAPGMPQNTNSGNSACLRSRKAWERGYPSANEWKEFTPFHWTVDRDSGGKATLSTLEGQSIRSPGGASIGL
jgi:hypothetical protein